MMRLKSDLQDLTNRIKKEYQDYTKTVSADKILSVCENVLSLTTIASKSLMKRSLWRSPWTAAGITVIGGVIAIHKLRKARSHKSNLSLTEKKNNKGDKHDLDN